MKPGIVLSVAGTPVMVPQEAADKLVRLAALVAVEAPLRQGSAARAGIDWQTVHEVRKELEALGVDWQALVRRRQEIERKAVARAVAERQAAAGAAP